MKDFEQYLTLRASVYRILALAFYREPSEEDFKRLKKYLPVLEEMAKGYENTDMIEGTGLLKAFLQEYGQGAEAVSICGRLFAALFLSTGLSVGKKSVIAQESVYLSPNHLSMQEPRDEVLEEYYKLGLGKKEGFSEPEDHVSAEFYFFAYIGEKLRNELENGDSIAAETFAVLKRFMASHILKWVPDVCSDLNKASDDDYYKGIAMLTSGFIAIDNSICDDITFL